MPERETDALAMDRVAYLDPDEVGANFTTREQVAPADSAAGHVELAVPNSLGLLPVNVGAGMGTPTVDVLVIVSVRVAVLPVGVLGKLSELGVTAKLPTAPVPASEAVAEPTASVALLFPAEAGEKTALMVQVAPAASVLAPTQDPVPGNANWDASVPVMVAAGNAVVAEVVLVTVKVRAALVVPTPTPPKLADAGVMASGLTAVPVMPTELPPTESVALLAPTEIGVKAIHFVHMAPGTKGEVQ